MCTVSASYQALEIGLIAGPRNRHHIRPQLIVVVVVFVVAVFVAPSSPSSLPSSRALWVDLATGEGDEGFREYAKARLHLYKIYEPDDPVFESD